MNQNFLNAFATHKGYDSVESLLADRSKFEFQLSTNERGRETLERIRPFIAPPLTEVSVLDIGCAYGGMCMAFAEQGAMATGIDIGNGYIDVANQNASGEPNVRFYEADATRVDLQQILGKTFNFIMLNDVVEHIYDTYQLFENIKRCTTENAQIFMRIPNGFNLDHVLAEPHKKVLGLSLIDPDCWQYFGLKTRPQVFYRQLGYYLMLINGFNLGTTKIVNQMFSEARLNADPPRSTILEGLKNVKSRWGKIRRTGVHQRRAEKFTLIALNGVPPV